MKIAATGLSGLVGSRIRELLSEKHEFVPIGLSAGVDITKKDSIVAAVPDSNADIVLNLAGKADVDGSEKEKEKGTESEAWKLNALGAENVAFACSESKIRLVHISSDFIFDGQKEFYAEDDIPTEATCWYGQTKLEGERAIQKVNSDFIIARIAYPYRSAFEKKDFVHAMMERFENGDVVKAVADHIFTPTFIDDIAHALDLLFEHGENGIYHVVGSGGLSPYEAAVAICKEFEFDAALIQKSTRGEFFEGRATRPFKLYLINDKIQKLGAEMKTFSEGLAEIHKQLA